MTDKYPRTPHFSFSPGKSADDIEVVGKADGYDPYFTHGDVIFTEKLDGGNCCLKDGQVFARTHGKVATHASFSQVKQLYLTCILPVMDQELGEDASRDYELFGENMEAVHSINYSPEVTGAGERHALPSCFYLFAVFSRSTQRWLDFDVVSDIACALNIPTVPVLWRGPFKNFPGLNATESAAPSVDLLEASLQSQIKSWMDGGSKIGPQKPRTPAVMEGVVMRIVGEINPDMFGMFVCKYVRKGHIQTDETFKWSWKHANIVQQ